MCLVIFDPSRGSRANPSCLTAAVQIDNDRLQRALSGETVEVVRVRITLIFAQEVRVGHVTSRSAVEVCLHNAPSGLRRAVLPSPDRVRANIAPRWRARHDGQSYRKRNFVTCLFDDNDPFSHPTNGFQPVDYLCLARTLLEPQSVCGVSHPGSPPTHATPLSRWFLYEPTQLVSFRGLTHTYQDSAGHSHSLTPPPPPHP